ncbi:hypothetical protein [Ottowia oryzae]|uniref:hypothetical protein n=1 Tax=Ottowia oryzae TaxID=2109914 RepID=UPI000F4DDFE3|nr:hypothetical protein [Ottowia oryzae]
MDISKKLARLLGPSIAVIVAAELPFIQPGLYEGQTVTGVYVSGMMMFVGGLAIVLSHNIWTRDWRTLNTLVGWFMLLLGVLRLFTATSYSKAFNSAPQAIFLYVELFLIALGLVLTYFGFRAESKDT